MPATTLSQARAALDAQIDRTADEIAEMIKALRKQRRTAMKAGDRTQARRANKALLSYNDSLATLVRGKIKAMDSANDVQALIAGFKAVTADLKEARKSIQETKAFIDKAIKIVKVVEKVAKKALTLV